MKKTLKIDYTELSKEISYALRHAPWEYELELDCEGWVPTDQLLNALRNFIKWKDISLEDIEKMIQTSSKKRHEISNEKIRAFYGHSVPMKIERTQKTPPEILYHGTTNKAVKHILQVGLTPQKRQYVHLSQDRETAYDVGKRRDKSPVILKVDAKRALTDGITFYLGNEKVWLADDIPAQYLSII